LSGGLEILQKAFVYEDNYYDFHAKTGGLIYDALILGDETFIYIYMKDKIFYNN